MSEFRRFISYIYSYHKGEKLQNTGFAKIEARGELCRMEIHIKGAYPGKLLQCNAYGFYRKNGLMKGILLGKFVVKNGIGDVRIVTDRNRMGNTNKSLEELGGIYITINGEEDNAMASEWDNVPVDTGCFKVHSKEDEVVEEVAEESSFPREEAMEMDLQGESQGNAEEVGTTGEIGTEEVETAREIKAAGKIREAGEVKAAGEIREAGEVRTAKETGTEEVETTGEIEAAEKVGTIRKVEEIETTEKVEKIETAQSDPTAEKKLDAENSTSSTEHPDTVLNEQSILCGEMNIDVDNYQKNDSECGEKTEWKTLLKEYPIVNPFAYLDNIEVIKIQPKDINRLAKKYWVLGSNSFLLHGYCSYRYLILGRNIRENTFFIGIPGVFHPREKMMASMFGFNEFRMSRNGRLRQGEFGYYIRQVELEA